MEMKGKSYYKVNLDFVVINLFISELFSFYTLLLSLIKYNYPWFVSNINFFVTKQFQFSMHLIAFSRVLICNTPCDVVYKL